MRKIAMRATIFALTVAATVGLAGTTAQAASPSSGIEVIEVASTNVDVSAGLFLYVRLSKGEVQSFPDTVLAAGGGGVAAYLCPKIPNALAKAACGAVGSAYVGSVIGTIRDAKKAGQCVELRYNYAPQLLVGWRRYGC